MKNYLLDNYSISKRELLQSFFVSEYGLRHWAQSKKQTECKWRHRIIAGIELCPLIGLLATITEKLGASYIRSTNKPPPPSPKPSPQNQTSLIKDSQWLFKGTQAGCNGAVSVAKVESIRAKLDVRRPIGIQFNQKKVVDSIEGGTCSAMSLEFLDSYFKAKKINVKTADEQSALSIDRIVKLSQKFASSSQEMKSRQAAYNTIEVDRSLGSAIDYSKNKVQSLANYHSLVIDYSSSEIDTEKLDHERRLSKELKDLPEGAFLVRILKPAKNDKLEEYGHSFVYIKENDMGLFYDPNQGVRNLSPSEHSKILLEEFKNYFRAFGINNARFYRMRPAVR